MRNVRFFIKSTVLLSMLRSLTSFSSASFPARRAAYMGSRRRQVALGVSSRASGSQRKPAAAPKVILSPEEADLLRILSEVGGALSRRPGRAGNILELPRDAAAATFLPSYLPTFLPSFLPTYLPAAIRFNHLQKPACWLRLLYSAAPL